MTRPEVAPTLPNRLSGQDVTRVLAGLASVEPLTVDLGSGVRLHALQTGWIAVKHAHIHLGRVSALRLPAILADRWWAAPRPILCWLVEHPEGLILVDTGERSAHQDLERATRAADPASRFILTRNFRLHVRPEDDLPVQLKGLGVTWRDIRWVVQTHLHFDHADGLVPPHAMVLVSREELEGHAARPLGAVHALRDPSSRLTPLDLRDGPFGAFTSSHRLTRAGDVVIVPTPGHSYGHQSVVVLAGDHAYVLAGDAVFDETQFLSGRLGGITHDLARARSSLARLRDLAATMPVVLLPSHDPDARDRLAGRRTTRPRENMTG